MNSASTAPASIAQPKPGELVLSGYWTALGSGALPAQLETLGASADGQIVVDGAQVKQLDTVGVWLLQKLLQRLRDQGHSVQMQGWSSRSAKLLELVANKAAAPDAAAPGQGMLERLGRNSLETWQQALALLSFVGEISLALAHSLAHPRRMRWRPILYNLRSTGFDALVIIGLLSFLLGIVIAYQGADQLRRYGANIFVADLVGLSMLREFAPLMTAIIVAGRSGSAFAAQIGTMAVTEEIDAMRTLGIAPIELLVLPKILALVLALPLLTVFADVLGVFGGMIMARAQLGVGFEDFLERFVKAVSVPAYLIGIGKAPVFACIIAVVGCFQGFRTKGGADSVGRQTTRAVVQAIFIVIVVDALFSILFSLLDL